MLVTPLVLIQIFSKRMLVDWPKCGSALEMRVTWHVWSTPGQEEGRGACHRLGTHHMETMLLR